MNFISLKNYFSRNPAAADSARGEGRDAARGDCGRSYTVLGSCIASCGVHVVLVGGLLLAAQNPRPLASAGESQPSGVGFSYGVFLTDLPFDSTAERAVDAAVTVSTTGMINTTGLINTTDVSVTGAALRPQSQPSVAPKASVQAMPRSSKRAKSNDEIGDLQPATESAGEAGIAGATAAGSVAAGSVAAGAVAAGAVAAGAVAAGSAVAMVQQGFAQLGSAIPYGTPFGERGSGVRFGPKPPYPLAARRAGFEGAVVLRVLVDESGTPRVAQVERSSGRHDCDESAQRTVQNKWLFEPGSWAESGRRTLNTPERPGSAGPEFVDERVVVVRYSLNG